MKIPFNKPFIIGNELKYIASSVKSGHIAGDGLFAKKCQSLLEKKLRAKKILLTPSCTASLEIAAILLNLKKNDEIIMPSFTFVSTANAFTLHKAKPVFVDINPDTLNIDENLIEAKITPLTKAIVVVHYAGTSCNMNKIMSLAKKYKLIVIEDAAQALNAKYKNKYLGTIGDIGTFSFHETKNYICGEGGAIVINNKRLIERTEIIREKGTDRSKFFRGTVDKYRWVDLGSSYLPSEIQSAFLFAQLEHIDKITKKRKKIYHYYLKHLKILETKNLLKLPTIPKYCIPNYHLFYIIVNDEETRNKMLLHLKKHSIGAVFHYLPLHSSPYWKKTSKTTPKLFVTDSISSTIIRLPFYYELTIKDLAIIVKTIKKYFLIN